MLWRVWDDMKPVWMLVLLFGVSNAYAMADAEPGLGVALQDTYLACFDISDELNKLKTMAGIGTAVSGVGTVTGVVATASGAKSVKSLAEQQEAQATLQKLKSDMDAAGVELVNADKKLQESEVYNTEQKSMASLDAVEKDLRSSADTLSKTSAYRGYVSQSGTVSDMYENLDTAWAGLMDSPEYKDFQRLLAGDAAYAGGGAPSAELVNAANKLSALKIFLEFETRLSDMENAIGTLDAQYGALSSVGLDDYRTKLAKWRDSVGAHENANNQLKKSKAFIDYQNAERANNAATDAYTKQKPELEKQATQAAAQAKKSGNLRTGMLAGTTATNVAGAVMAGSNRGRVNGTLGEMVDGCVDAVKVLSNVYGQARITSPTDANLKRAERVIRACRDWETVNLGPIRNRATGAMVSNIVGAGTGAVGTIVSAVSVSKEDLERAQKLGKTANTMAGVATVASGVATIFNASQIGAIKRAAAAADACRDALSGVGE